MRRAGNECLNCHQALEKDYHYCPHCGQENNDQQVGIRTLAGDFLSNYFALDSRLGKSIRHFFLRPGFLTLRFNEGKRARYIHPLRLYLIISVFFFFLLSYMLSFELADASLHSIAKKQSSSTASEVVAAMQDQQAAGATKPDKPKATGNQQDFQTILSMLRNEELTDEMVMDSLQISSATKENEQFQLALHQGRRVVQKDLDVFIPYVLKNLPIMMFILLPFFAAYLMFLFRNRPNLYIRHIIHALHLHAFAFFLLTIFLLIGWTTGSYYFWIVFLLITLYAFLSIKNVYQQRWIRTGFKFLLLGTLYFNTLLLFVLLEMTWSFFTF